MKDIPIIMSAPMVRALLDGRKTMTRRLARQTGAPKVIRGREYTGYDRASKWSRAKPGDSLWVRENWRADDFAPDDPERTIYQADVPADALNETRGIIKWRPSIHLPRARSRLTLNVTAIKVERLQDISEEDARAEGVTAEPLPGDGWTPYRASFALLWDALHGPDAWHANPLVVAITFDVLKQNIGDLARPSPAGGGA